LAGVVLFSTLAAVRPPDAAAAGFFETLIHTIADPPTIPASPRDERTSSQQPIVRRTNVPRVNLAAKAPPKPPIAKAPVAKPLIAKALVAKPLIANASPKPLAAQAPLKPLIAKASPKPLIANTSTQQTAGRSIVRSKTRLSERQRMARAVALARQTWGLRTDGQRLTGVRARRQDATELVVTAVGHDYHGGTTTFRMVVREWYGMQFVSSDDTIAETPSAASSPSPLAAQ